VRECVRERFVCAVGGEGGAPDGSITNPEIPIDVCVSVSVCTSVCVRV